MRAFNVLDWERKLPGRFRPIAVEGWVSYTGWHGGRGANPSNKDSDR